MGDEIVVAIPAERVEFDDDNGRHVRLDFGELQAGLVDGMVTICQIDDDEIDDVALTPSQTRRLVAGLADLLGPDPAAPPPLLPPLTAVQRAWVVGMAANGGGDGRYPGWARLVDWAQWRWGVNRTEMLRCLSLAVGEWRAEQEGARDA